MTGHDDRPSSDNGRVRVLHALRDAPGALGVMDLAARSGLHANTVRFHLDRLVAAGLVARQVEARTGPGRPRLAFTATPQHEVAGGKRSYQFLADMLAGFVADSSPDGAAPIVELGRTWGRYLATTPAPARRVTERAALDELVRVLDDIGFDPALAVDDGKPTQVLLRHCPFLEVATTHRDVVCSLHLGVMQGALAEQRAPVETTELQPFVEPSLCVAQLGRSDGPQPSGSATTSPPAAPSGAAVEGRTNG